MEKIIINIDSKYRDIKVYPTPSKFTVKLDNVIKNVIDINISSIEFINLYYSFSQNKKNVSFIIKMDNVEYKIEINDGFFTTDDLLTAIQTIFDNTLPYSTTITLDTTNGKVTIDSIHDFSINFDNNSIYPSLGYLLGFRNNTCTSTLITKNNTNSYYVKTESLLNVIGDNYMFLKVNDYGTIYTKLLKNNTNNILYPYNILGKIIISANKTQATFDNNNFITKKHIFRQPTNISKFDIELIDPYGNLIDMLLIDFSFTLELNYLYVND
jgi:hypothetical protein